MIKASHLEELVIRPTLALMGKFNPKLNTPASVNLMLGVAAQESDLGFYMRQHPTGPGRGLCSVETPTHNDVVHRYLAKPRNQALRDIIESLVSRGAEIGDDAELATNPKYNVAIARTRLWWVPDALPAPDDLPGLGKYWDDHYNINATHGTVEEFVDSWWRYVKRNP